MSQQYATTHFIDITNNYKIYSFKDDFMGAATLDLTTLDLSRPTDITLPLQDPARPETSLGEILLSVTLVPKTQEDKEQVIIYTIFYTKKNNTVFFR